MIYFMHYNYNSVLRMNNSMDTESLQSLQSLQYQHYNAEFFRTNKPRGLDLKSRCEYDFLRPGKHDCGLILDFEMGHQASSSTEPLSVIRSLGGRGTYQDNPKLWDTYIQLNIKI